jgi:arylsulfatase A-like enzyme
VPGAHRLTLVRPGASSRDERDPLELEKIEFNCGPLSGTLRADLGPRLKRMAGFLDSGVFLSGEGRVRRGGFIFRGPHRRQVRLSLTAAAVLRTTTGNRSDGEARFAISSGSESAESPVPPGGEGTLGLRLPPGDHLLTFSVDGPAEGDYWWGSPYPWPEEPADLPPIIIITLDTTRRDAVSPYDRAGDTTPVLRAFSGEATVYTRAFAVSPWTLPSHASIFTGRYPSEHGAGVRRASLPPRAETLAELLRARGYLTAGFAGGALSSARYGVAQGFSRYRDPDGYQTRARPLTDAVVDYLHTVENAPLFLFVNYFDPHFPYVAPKRFRNQFNVPLHERQLAGLPHWRSAIAGDSDAFRQVRNSRQPAPEEALLCLRAAYRSEVAYMDQQLGLLFDELRRQGLYQRAFIAILADHGEFLGEHGFYDHSFRLDPELIEIPCLIKWPGQTRSQVVDLPVSQVDLFPTILQLAGIEARPSSGVTLRQGDTAGLAQRPWLLMEEHSQPEVHFLGPRSIKLADHLYGLVSAGERTWAWEGGQRCSAWERGQWTDQPCAGSWPETLEALRDRFEAGDPAESTQTESLEDEEREKLRQLGYLE